MKTIWLDNEQQLDAFASEFAQTLQGGEVIGLVGDLGSGKTSFVQRVAAALGVKEQVKSPTFMIRLTACILQSATPKRTGKRILA